MPWSFHSEVGIDSTACLCLVGWRFSVCADHVRADGLSSSGRAADRARCVLQRVVDGRQTYRRQYATLDRDRTASGFKLVLMDGEALRIMGRDQNITRVLDQKDVRILPTRTILHV